MTSKNLLIQLIEYLEIFEKTLPQVEEMGMEAFLAFASSLCADSRRDGSAHQHSLEVGIARHLSLLHRFSRSYIKKALQTSECLQSEEEYTYLVCLMGEDGLTRTELHQRNGLERSTGAEVLSRLSQHGLIEEMPAPNDRRSKLVSITPRGRAELMRVFPALRQAATILSAPIEEWQRRMLMLSLEHLCLAHASLQSTLKDASLDEYENTIRP